ncbi:retrovirus-related Pol polyprotein from transposon 412 [Trichonephila clavipes]|nr:retrovirus-related Pol polyprotein from transposon 412 [Trichonephila clavipes]
MVNAVETRSQKKLTEESKQDLNMSEETIPESNEKNKESPDELDDILPLIQPEISESNLIKLSHKDFAKEQMNSAELKTLFEEAKSGSSKKNHYIVENNLLFFQKEDKEDTKRKCLVVPEKKIWSKSVRSSVYHPLSNPVERMHRTLKRILRVLCLEAIPDWEKILPQALFALRTVIHDSTGFSPAELVHGKNLRTPVMLLYEKLT